MAKTYRPYVPEQDLLLPPSLKDWLPEDHLAFFVSDLIDQLDLSAVTKSRHRLAAGVVGRRDTLAFRSERDGGGIFVVPALGGR